jgi:hypothetical protein
MAREILETAKKMELQGLKFVLRETLENPMVPAQAKTYAELAYRVACDLELDLEWRDREVQRWADHLGLTVIRDPPANGGRSPPRAVRKDGSSAPIPRYMTREPMNLQRRLDYAIAQIGMVAADTVWNDIIAPRVSKVKIDVSDLPPRGEADEASQD